jgi:hypothetical protein
MYTGDGKLMTGIFPKTSLTTQDNRDTSGSPLWYQLYVIPNTTQTISK